MKLKDRFAAASAAFRGKSTSSSENMILNQLLSWLGVHDTESTAQSEATYFACLKVLSESIGKLPLKVQQYTPEHGVRIAREHRYYRMLNERPNRYMTASVFWSTVELCRNHYGNGYVWITGAGSKTNLWILPSQDVQVYIDDRGIFGTKNAVWYVYTSSKNGKLYKIPYDSILHFKTSSSFDGITGRPVRDMLSETLVGNLKAQKMLNKLYDNGFTAKAVVQYTGSLNDELVKKYVKGIEDYATGKVDDVKSIIPIPIGSTLTPLNVNLTDNQFLELKKYSALQIAAAFGIKPNQINDYEKSSYASSEAQQLAFYVDTLLYIIKQYEEEICNKLLSDEEIANGYYAKFNISVILRADSEKQTQSLKEAVQGSLRTPNEARAMLDLPARPGGDVLLCNGSMMPVQMAGQQYSREGGET